MSFLRKQPEHQWVEESLSAYIDGELTARERARVEKHLEECHACAENLATLRQTVALVRELPPVRAPRSFAIRPEVVEARPRLAPSAWGYGLLKGATALAALLLMLLVGGDLALRFASVTYFAPWGAAAPPPEVAFAPSAMPAPAEEPPILGQTKESEVPQAPAPESTEQVALQTPEAAADLAEPEDTPKPAMREEGAQPAGTPTAEPTPAAAEGEMIGGGAAETPPASPAAPAPAPTSSEEEPSAAEPALPSATPPEGEEYRGVVPEPAETPKMLAMTEGEQRVEDEAVPLEVMAQSPPWSPLRLAEWIALGLLVVLLPATAIAAWLRRRAGR